NNSQMVGTTGITGAAPIWHTFMENAFQILNLPPKDFPQPPGVEYGSECRLPSGYGGYVMSSFGYDLFAGVVPYCAIGDQYASAPAVDQSQQSTGAYVAPTAAPVYSAPVATEAPAPAPTLAPVAPPTLAPATQAP